MRRGMVGSKSACEPILSRAYPSFPLSLSMTMALCLEESSMDALCMQVRASIFGLDSREAAGFHEFMNSMMNQRWTNATNS